MQIAAVDDDKVFVKYEKEIISKILAYMDIEAALNSFSSGSAFLESIDNVKYDVVFLDIDMPDINGFEIAKKINDKYKDCFIIFVTNHAHLVYNSLEYFPLTFIRKQELENGIKRVFSHIMKLNTKKKCLSVKCNDSIVKLPINDIIYIESFRSQVNIYTLNEEYLISKKISSMEQELEKFDFLRPHKCYLVNFMYIHSLEKKHLVLTNGLNIPISKYRLSKMRSQFTECVRKTLC